MTATRALPGGRIARRGEFFAGMAKTFPGLATGHLARLYGTRLNDVVAMADNRPDLLDPVAMTGDIGAQVVFAAREEMAMTLADAVMRRTGVGQLGDPGDAALARAADLMAQELGWTEGRKRREIESVSSLFRLREAA